MHSDERIELRDDFIHFLNENGWIIYLKSEKKIIASVNFLFRLIYILFVAAALGLAFASMRHYLPKIYGWGALGAAVIWIIIERLNLKKIDIWLMKRKQNKLIKKLQSNNSLLDKIEEFENLDIVPEDTKRKLEDMINGSHYDRVIEMLHQILFYLKAVKSIEENQREFDITNFKSEYDIEPDDENHYRSQP